MPRPIPWRLVGSAVLLLAMALAAAPTPDRPTAMKNWRVQPVPAEGPFLADVRPDKLFYFTGEPVLGVAQVANPGATELAAELRAWLEQGLDQRVGEQLRRVTVPPNAVATATFSWPAAQVARYGQAVRMELLVGGQVVARSGDPFAVHDNVWAVGIAGNHPVGFTAEHVKDLAGIERAVEGFRDKYTNTFEKFFWAPDDFADMTPDREQWFSGQARYHERLDRLQHMCAYGRKIGVLPTTYGKSIGSGSGARDAIRAHPELVYGFGGVMEYAPDTEELAKWDLDTKPYWQSIGWAMYNMNDPAVVQHGIHEIAASTKLFGWAGVRFDGHFRARAGKVRVGDREQVFTAAQADAQTAANQRALKEAMREVDPRFVYGYNFAECDFTGRLMDNPRESLELCAGGGHLMDEYAKQNAGASHPYRKWADYAHAIVKSTEQVRRLGGHYFPMVHPNGPVGRYQTLLTYAAGAHPNSTPWGIDHPYNAFATRYAELLWGADVRNVWNPCGIVIASPGVWWEDYLREQRLDATHTRLILHLINPPAHATATESQAAMDELLRRDKRRRELQTAADQAKAKPDFSELDALPPVVLFPEPQREVPVKLVAQALPDGPWQLQQARLLDPETSALTPLPVDTSDRYFAQVTVPELKCWAIVVFDLTRKEP